MFNEIYAERDQLIAALSKIWPSVVVKDPSVPDWPVILVNSPAGQLSWHVKASERNEWFSHLPDDDSQKWDGHTTEEKYRRLNSIKP